MTSENYHKCRTCKYCRHEGGRWMCVPEGTETAEDSSCGRYRPGCCENCLSYSDGVCEATGERVDGFGCCPDYDPSGLD